MHIEVESPESRRPDVEEIVFNDIEVKPSDGLRFTLDGKPIDLWSEECVNWHSKTPTDYVREEILRRDREEIDAFPDIVGKTTEKELVKEALFSGSPILFRGERGYGKTSFSKAIAKLLPNRLLAMKDCKIHDDPVKPVCFSCKAKIMNGNHVELTWIPRIWIRIPGDPMLTTRQLVGGISIQKIREGLDLDHPEVFIPGRSLKANRGLGYFDELGSVPTSLQTLLHELFEEGQVTTSEGELVPFKISTIEIASTNPANYRGTSPIKEPLLDRMEVIEIGPPATLEEEIEIAKRNMFTVKTQRRETRMPRWHQEILARTVRFGRNKDECDIAKKIQSEPSCRATIKLFDHVTSRALRRGREVPLLEDYGEKFEIVYLAIGGRIEIEYGVKEGKEEVVRQLVLEAIRRTCVEIYDKIPPDDFQSFLEELALRGSKVDGEVYLAIDAPTARNLRDAPITNRLMSDFVADREVDDQLFISTLEVLLHSVSLCVPRYVSRKGSGYLIRRPSEDEARVRSLPRSE